MNKSASSSWAKTVATLCHVLPLQNDIFSLLNAIKDTCVLSVPYQYISLIISSDEERAVTLYTLDTTSMEETTTHASLLKGWESKEFLSRGEVARYTLSHMATEISHNAFFYNSRADETHYLHIPFCNQVQSALAIQFITTNGHTFSEQDIELFGIIRSVINNHIHWLLTKKNFETQIESLWHERDYFSLLADVTNIAITTTDLSKIINSVAECIKRFFGIRTFALMLLDTDNNGETCTFIPSKDTSAFGACDSKKQFNLHESQLLSALDYGAFTLLTREQFGLLSQDSALLSLLLANNNDVVCIFPLLVGERCLGAMVLAHQTASLFTQEVVFLLQQVAERVAIATASASSRPERHKSEGKLLPSTRYFFDQTRGLDEFGEIIGKSDAIKVALEQVVMVAPSDSTVLILGETGTGKEVFARAIHNRSSRSSKSMVKMNCGAVPAGLIESELFGHEKGAFTGAIVKRKGRFELASGSSLMLDEVGDIPLDLQAKLLRVLQEREIERLGSSKVIPVDVRVIAATNRNLHQMVADGRYRSDFFYRLNVFPITIPPLRERREDIPLLATFFAEKISQQMGRTIDYISSKAMKELCSHFWPGNVRELANVIERAVILSTGTTLELFPIEKVYSPPKNSFSVAKNATVDELSFNKKRDLPTGKQKFENIERQRIINALVESNGVVAGARGAAVKLGLKRTTLLSRMQRMGINVKNILGDNDQ